MCYSKHTDVIHQMNSRVTSLSRRSTSVSALCRTSVRRDTSPRPNLQQTHCDRKVLFDRHM